MRVLVTGADGFVGRYMLKELSVSGHIAIPSDTPAQGRHEQEFPCDIRDASSVETLVKSASPDACIHLAGISSVAIGNTDPALLFAVNVSGTVNLLEALRRQKPDTRLLVISTAHVYGTSAENTPAGENAPLRPANLYAASKAAADLASLAYADSFNMPIMTVRPNNHIGPGQSMSFVISSFASQLRKIATGGAQGPVKTGNMESLRDFMDVRDVVKAYRLLIEKGSPGKTYNLSSGNIHKIGDMFKMLCDLAGVQPDTEIDPAKFRPLDCSPLLDISRIESAIGWRPEIGIKQTLSDILESLS